MAVLTFATISDLENTSWEIDHAEMQTVSFTPSDTTIDFGAYSVVDDIAIIECDRHECERSQNGGQLSAAEDEFGNLTGIKFAWSNAIQKIQQLDITGTVLTITYNSNYIEVYNQL